MAAAVTAPPEGPDWCLCGGTMNARTVHLPGMTFTRWTCPVCSDSREAYPPGAPRPVWETPGTNAHRQVAEYGYAPAVRDVIAALPEHLHPATDGQRGALLLALMADARATVAEMRVATAVRLLLQHAPAQLA